MEPTAHPERAWTSSRVRRAGQHGQQNAMVSAHWDAHAKQSKTWEPCKHPGSMEWWVWITKGRCHVEERGWAILIPSQQCEHGRPLTPHNPGPHLHFVCFRHPRMDDVMATPMKPGIQVCFQRGNSKLGPFSDKIRGDISDARGCVCPCTSVSKMSLHPLLCCQSR